MAKPIIHGRDHAAGGADPIPGLGSSGGGSGIQFEVDPQSGAWLQIKTTGYDPAEGYGLYFRADGDSTGPGGIELFTRDPSVGVANEIAIGQYDSYSVGLALFANGGIQIDNTSGGDIDIRNHSGALRLRSLGSGGVTIEDGSGGIAVSSSGALGVEVGDGITLAGGGGSMTVEVSNGSGGQVVLIYGVGGSGVAGGSASTPALKIENTGGSWHYHILTGATWAADL